MKRLTFLTIIFSLFVCCQHNSKHDSIRQMDNNYYGEIIKIPASATDARNGEVFDFDNSDFIIINYVDGNDWTSCKLNVEYWTEFMELVDSVADATVTLLTAVGNGTVEEIKNIFDRESFDHPILLDNNHYCLRNIDFSDNPHYKTFLLNRNFGIISTGNPILSPAVADLYLSIISGEHTFGNKKSSEVRLKSNRINLGLLSYGEKSNHKVLLQNCGTDTVHMKEIISSCECTETTILNRTILPGKSEDIKIHITADSITGKFHRTIHIFYDNFDYPSVIDIEGEIIAQNDYL